MLAGECRAAYDSGDMEGDVMLRLIASTVLELLANAIGLLVAF
jgi:hypothetical protein